MLALCIETNFACYLNRAVQLQDFHPMMVQDKRKFIVSRISNWHRLIPLPTECSLEVTPTLLSTLTMSVEKIATSSTSGR